MAGAAGANGWRTVRLDNTVGRLRLRLTGQEERVVVRGRRAVITLSEYAYITYTGHRP